MTSKQGMDFASAAKLPIIDGQAVYLGRIDYGVAWKLQQLLVEQRQHCLLYTSERAELSLNAVANLPL